MIWTFLSWVLYEVKRYEMRDQKIYNNKLSRLFYDGAFGPIVSNNIVLFMLKLFWLSIAANFTW